MDGWNTRDEGGEGRFQLGANIGKQQQGRQSPTNVHSPLSPTTSNRTRASLRLKSAQGKVLRAIRVQRRITAVGVVRDKARSNWQRGATKMASLMGFKWLGTNAVRKRKRSIFGNVLGAAPMDDSTMPKVSLHQNNGDSSAPRNRKGSTVSSITLNQRPTSPVPNRRPSGPSPESPAEPGQSSIVHRREKAATAESVEKQVKRQALKKKFKGSIGKVQKFVRTVRLSYTDTFSGAKKVSLDELLGRLRSHYDPDGIHRDANDDQHAVS